MDILNILMSESFWAASLRIATPLIFGVLGALICERAGVLNLGIEGIFVVGAMCGWMAVWLGAGLWGGVLVAALAGAFFGLLHAILTVPLGLSQHVSGLGITLFATSVSYFTYRTALPNVSSPPRIEPFQALDVPILSDLPFLGPVLFQQTALTWLALLMVVLVWYVMNHTALGVAIKAVGDNPDSVDAQGLSVYGLRIRAIVAGSALMALGAGPLALSPCSVSLTQTRAKASPPIPLLFGSNTVRAAAVAIAASMALPPLCIIDRPICAACGWVVDTMPFLAKIAVLLLL